MPSTCSVTGCKSRCNAGPKKQFFRFPLNRPKVLQQWLMVLDRLDWVPKPSSKICSDHFASEDFLYRPNVTIPRLKPEAVPSIFPDPDTTQEDLADDAKSVDSSINAEEDLEGNQENINENSTNVSTTQPEKNESACVSDDAYPKRPKRTSKINVKMKDFILLDDLKKVNRPSVDSPKSKLLEKESTPDKSEASFKTKFNEKTDYSSKLKQNVKNTDVSQTLNKGIEASKVDAAKKLLSILEDSDDELNDSKEIENLNENGDVSDEDSLGENIVFQRIVKGKQLKVDKKNQGVHLDHPKNIAEIAIKRKPPIICFKSSLPPSEEECALYRSSIKKNKKMRIKPSIGKKSSSAKLPVSDKSSEELNTTSPRSNTSKGKIPMQLRTKRPSTDLAKTYFPIRCGENFFYFSYADLNPVVDLSRQNVLMKEDFQNGESISNENKNQIKKKFKRRNNDMNIAPSSKKSKTCENEDNSGAISEEEEHLSTGSENNIDVSGKVLNSSESDVTYDPRSDNSENCLTSDEFVELDSDKLQASESLIDHLEKMDIIPPATSKRKKRFKTVAEIVVRTDNAKPGEMPFVSIDKIKNLIDFKTAKPPLVGTITEFKPSKPLENHSVDFKAPKSPVVKKVKRGSLNHENTDAVDVNDNLNHITMSNEEEPTDEELTRLSQRITETVKQMKLLDKVKGNSSKLTVLITTLPPVKEKEILIIKKKNVETNRIQSSELQVVISSHKGNETALHGNIILANPFSYTILPAVKNNASNIPSSNDSESKTSDEVGDSSSSPDQEHASIVCYQDKGESEDNSEKDVDPAATPGENVDHSYTANESHNTAETGENENNSGEAIIHDHAYITPNVKYLVTSPNVELNVPETQSKETPSKGKLSENEVLFRSKVCIKLKNMKENIKKKNDTIGKLKDKIRFLERTLRDVKRTKKQPITKAIKKDSSALLKNDIFYGVDPLVDSGDFANTMDYSLNNMELPLGLEENGEESEDDDGERECSSPITYLCEPAIDAPSKERDIAN